LPAVITGWGIIKFIPGFFPILLVGDPGKCEQKDYGCGCIIMTISFNIALIGNP